eukprot:s7625_g2.t1
MTGADDEDPPERRVNPYDKQAYSYAELLKHYKEPSNPRSIRRFRDLYSEEQVDELWRTRMAKTRPRLLQDASPEKRADRDFVLKAVRLRGPELRHAAPVLQKDKEVALAAIMEDCHVAL